MKLDLGCGKAKREGFIGVDALQFEGVDVVCDLGREKWPWADDTVDEVHCSHMIEHLKASERVHFVNELHRVLKKGAKAMVIAPVWSSCRAYGDLTHQWPPVSEFWFPYLNKTWRDGNAPHNTGYTCDFDSGYGYTMSPALTGRSQEYVQHALNHYKESGQDLVATLVKR